MLALAKSMSSYPIRAISSGTEKSSLEHQSLQGTDGNQVISGKDRIGPPLRGTLHQGLSGLPAGQYTSDSVCSTSMAASGYSETALLAP